MTPTVRVVGPGRAGGSLHAALLAAGWDVELMPREARIEHAAAGVDLLLLAVPDTSVATVANSVHPVSTTVVAHCAGALGLDVLDPHERRASLHPLVSMPNVQVGAERLRGAWFVRSGDALVDAIPEALGGRSVEVAETDRELHHAAAVMASNHLVALLGSVGRTAELVGVPLDAYLDLARGAVESVSTLGPVAALTGPVARGDVDMVRRHLEVLPEGERRAYAALAVEAARLAGRAADFAWLESVPD